MTQSLFDLTGRLALISGSSRGIGFAIAQALASAGALVVLNGRNIRNLEAAAENLRKTGAVTRIAPFDVTVESEIQTAIENIETNVGPIDILVNNAGMQYRSSLQDYPVEKWRELLRTNLDSVFLLSRAIAPYMISRRRGKIINICSVQSELARPTIAPYTASKGALKMLTKGMCADWAKHGLQINGIGPGYFKTELNQALVDDAEFTKWIERRTPAGRWGEVEELAGAAIFLAADSSSYINGQIIYVDGGMTSTL
jgi:gluconate 5-dehydrogenase